MKIKLRSAACIEGRRMAGARALWRANGMTDAQFGQPIIAVVNSFTQFVPGHVHLHEVGQHIKRQIEQLGCFAAEFNTIAIDDGIAMGHEGMLYSLPSRELIADSIEYMANAHCIDAMVCISNCDKITPGMLLAAIRLNIPAVFVSGGPMAAGELNGRPLDLIDVMVEAADTSIPDEDIEQLERAACPTCGSCSGMFTANSMNCLTEALGLALAGNGTTLAAHPNRQLLFTQAAQLIVENAYKYYRRGDPSVLPRTIASRQAFLNAMTLDIAMGGSTNTALHLLAVAHEANVDFSLHDIDALSKQVPVLCKVSPNHSQYHIQDVHRAGGVLAILNELAKADLLDASVKRVDGATLKETLARYDLLAAPPSPDALHLYTNAPVVADGSAPDTDRATGCIRNIAHAYAADGGLAVLYGNIATHGAIVKTAGVADSLLRFSGPAKVFHSQEAACEGILNGALAEGDVAVILYEGPRGGPGMQEMLYPTSYLKSRHLDKACALITDGRFSGGTSGLSIGHISPEAAAGGNIALLHNGDFIDIDIPARRLNARLTDSQLQSRRLAEERKGDKAFSPNRQRTVSPALQAYARLVSSADKGAVREL